MWGASTRADPGVAPVVEGRMVADAGWGRRWPQNVRPVMGGQCGQPGSTQTGGGRKRKGRDRKKTIFKGLFPVLLEGHCKTVFQHPAPPFKGATF